MINLQEFFFSIPMNIQPVIGVLTGFILSEFKNFLLDKRKGKAFKIMLLSEIEDNRKLLHNFLSKIKDVDNEIINEIRSCKDDFLTESNFFVSRVSKLNIPIFSDRIWKSDLVLIVDALSTNEINKVNDFYSNLIEISNMHKEILKVVESSQEIGILSDKYGYISFVISDTKIWIDLYNKIHMILEKTIS